MSASKPPSATASLTASIVAEARGALLARKASLAPAGGKAADGATAELHELDAALKRIDEGTWGRCQTCGGAIGRTRLRSLPEARQCLPCARAQP